MLSFQVPARDSAVWKTPMFEQYWRIKKEVPEALLFYRMGDFYELFGEDAVKAAPLLEIQLTARDKGAEIPLPMCGIPVHAWEVYAEKILGAGEKVALCEQLSDPSQKGPSKLVERGLVRILTPGLPIQPSKMEAKAPHWFLSVARVKGSQSTFAILAYDFLGAELFEGEGAEVSEIQDLLKRLDPKEILLPASFLSDEKTMHSLFGLREISQLRLSPWPGEDARSNFKDYLRYTQRLPEERLLHLVPESKDLWLLSGKKQNDFARLPSLVLEQWAVFPELFNLLDGAGSVLGSRKLRALLASPLANPARILLRQEALKKLEDPGEILEEAREVYDFERLLGRFRIGAASPKELVRFLSSVERIVKVLDLPLVRSAAWQQLFSGEGLGTEEKFRQKDELAMKNLAARLRSALKNGVDVLKVAKLSELIAGGYSPDFDELLAMSENAEKWLQSFEEKLQSESGIGTLKIRYNRVFGYYIEISKGQLARVPSYFERKQTTVNGERFTCPELRQKESQILSASVKTENRAKEILEELQKEILKFDAELRACLARFAWLDALAGLMSALTKLRRFGPWVFPEVNEGPFSFHIEEARHPVLEFLSGGKFIPNSLSLGAAHGSKRLLLLTGPNMAGKSTLMRQMGLCLLLAQVGFPVPAKKMSLAPAQAFYSRMGASDRILQGESTFMVEMKESALILREAGENSFVLIDEIGRGTSTEDGLSIARAVLEYLHDTSRSLSIFATHYHELSDVAAELPAAQNASLTIQEWKGELIFLRKLQLKAAESSYGIHVAKMAGLPRKVIQDAEKFFAEHLKLSTQASHPQMSLFEGGASVTVTETDFSPDSLRAELKKINLDNLSPRAAWLEIERLKELVEVKENLFS